jgi:O-antigen/teichoic acid export membrane protein
MGVRARSSRYLGASIVTAAISLLTFPLTTRILGPTDYGVLALGTAIAGVGTVLATLGMPFVLSRRWPSVGREERCSIVSTLAGIGLVISTVWLALAWLGFLVVRDDIGFLRELPSVGFALLLGGVVVAPIWLIASEVLTLEGRAGFYALATVAQAGASAGATLFALFVLDLGRTSLFIGLFVGSLAGLACGLFGLRPYLAPRFDDRWRRELAVGAFAPAQLAESAQPVVERVLLSRYAGFLDLGLYTHSQRYRQIALQATNAVSRGVWPVTLAEARDSRSTFPTTRGTWNAIHVGVTACGIALTALGDHFIALLTNDKFTPAYVYLAPWFVLLLLQLSAKPEVGTLFAHARGRTLAALTLVASISGIAAAAVLIPFFGVTGALVAVILQALVYRVVVRIPARRYRPIPFQDTWAVIGIVLLLATWVVKIELDPSLLGSLALLVVGEVLCLVVAARVVGETARRVAPWRTA